LVLPEPACACTVIGRLGPSSHATSGPGQLVVLLLGEHADSWPNPAPTTSPSGHVRSGQVSLRSGQACYYSAVRSLLVGARMTQGRERHKAAPRRTSEVALTIRIYYARTLETHRMTQQSKPLPVAGHKVAPQTSNLKKGWSQRCAAGSWLAKGATHWHREPTILLNCVISNRIPSQLEASEIAAPFKLVASALANRTCKSDQRVPWALS
jgi:hypothetical protein